MQVLILFTIQFEEMSLIIPRYFAPPRGHRTARTRPGGLTRRDKDEGPYGLFISYDEDEWAYPCEEEDIPFIFGIWERARENIYMILWGDQERRDMAKHSLDRLNEEIDTQAHTGYRCGWIETRNWYRAGEQLAKAVRDFHFYRSTAVGCPYHNLDLISDLHLAI